MTTRLEDRLNANVVAENARTARTSGARCGICQGRVEPGQRIADLANGRPVHVASCASRAPSKGATDAS